MNFRKEFEKFLFKVLTAIPFESLLSERRDVQKTLSEKVMENF